MLYIRGQSNDYNYWRQLGNIGWSWEDVLPYFKKSEDFQFGENEYHGSGGPIKVEKIRATFKVLDLFLKAADEFGYRKTDDFNNGDNEGMGYFPFTIKNGFRCSTAVGYLNPVKKRKNLKIITRAHIKNIEFENKKAKKVNYWQGEKLNTVEINKEIILSAGTIGSPHILQASGIGPGKLLRDNGINVIKEHSGIGQNLIDHLMLRPVYKVKNLETLNDIYYSFPKKVLSALKFIITRSGPLTVGASYVCGFVKSDEHLETPNLQFHISPASTDLLGKSVLHKFPAFTPTITNVRPTSRGSIELKSSDTRISPKIKMNYLSTDEDRQIAGKSLKIVRKIVMESKAYKEYQPEELRPGIEITDNEQLAIEAGKFANTIFHPVSTCRMGNDESAVVSDKLKVHGLENLRIIDASVMPYITSGNTNAPTIMIAEKGADLILNS
jgi:choline dehydrogenase